MDARVEDADRFLQKQSHYRGRAKVNIHKLTFDDPHLPGGRTLDHQNVVRLVQVFESEGCLRLEPEHSIPVLIEDDTLSRYLQSSGTSHAGLLDLRHIPPTLQLDGPDNLLALHGQHRIEAARRYLDTFDQWWVIDLYSTGLSESSVLDLRTEYSNARGFNDGDVFRHLRHYQLAQDHGQIGKWWARLSASKRKDVQTLLSKFESLTKAFDELLPFTGLWASLQLGTFHRILTLNCEEVSGICPGMQVANALLQEMMHYLHRIRSMWLHIMGDTATAVLLDSYTVHNIQLLAPDVSSGDRGLIVVGMETGRLFPNVRQPEVRASILSRCLEVSGRITSLFTFLEDTKYLEPCATIMKSLIGSKNRLSVAGAFRARYIHNDRSASIEVAGGEWQDVAPNSFSAARLAYLQLWLFCMRHFPCMHPINPRKDTGRPKPQYETKHDMWTNFGQLARRLRYDSAEINRLTQQDAFQQIVRTFVETARPRDSFVWAPDVINEEVERICRFLHSIPERDIQRPPPSVVNDIHELPMSHRCGRPFESSYLADRHFLYLGHIYNQYQTRGMYLSSFGVTRDVFLCFFGDIELLLAPSEIPLPPSNPPSAPTSSHSVESPAGCPSGGYFTPPLRSDSRNERVAGHASPGAEDANILHALHRRPSLQQPPDRPSSYQQSPGHGEEHSVHVETPESATNHSRVPYPNTTAVERVVHTKRPLNAFRFPEPLSSSPERLPGFVDSLEQGHVLFYNMHSCDIHVASGDSAAQACSTICSEYLKKGYTFFGVNSNHMEFLSPKILQQTQRYKLRFIVEKGGKASAVPHRAKQQAELLIDKYYPGLDGKYLVMQSGYGEYIDS